MNFDKENFSKILIKIKDSYGSINQMAEKTGITASYLSKLIRQMYDNPPSPEILKKISSNSNGISTYEDLMEICGHINKDDLDSYLLGMIGLTNNDLQSFTIKLNELNLNENEKNIFSTIIEEMMYSITYNKNFSDFDIYKYLTNVNQRGQAKIVTALELYMFYLQKIVNFSSVSFKNIPSKEKNKKSANLYNVPIVGKIAAGQPILAEEYVEGYLPVDPNIYGLTTSNDLFYLLVSGDSMDKKVENGDYVLIHKQDYANDGDIIVAIVNEQFVQLEPMSNNPIHQTTTIDLKTTKFMIIGKAIGKFGKF